MVAHEPGREEERDLEALLSSLEAALGNNLCAVNVPEPILSNVPHAGLDPKPRHGAWYFIDEFQHALEGPRETIC